MPVTQTIIRKIKTAVSEGVPVKVDGRLIQDARIREGEIEVRWHGEGIDPEIQWTTVQPNFMATENGELIIKTD